MNELSNTEAVNAEIDETLALLNTEQNLDEALRENVVLVVGLTGTGKSTLCQFLAGNQNLTSVEIGDTSSYYISDGNVKVSESNTKSKTLIPELVKLPDTKTVLADCPGFVDTRSAKYDIAAAVFTKQLLDKSKKVKILVAVAHHSVRKGVERAGFTNLLSHLVYFIKDIEKYENSIGLLITKVENQFVEHENGDIIYKTDTKIIDEIGSFLNEVRNELSEKIDNDFTSRQVQLIDSFIAKNHKNEYTRIGIFRRPTRSGNLNLNKRLSKNKNDMERIINFGLRSNRVEPNDFGLSLSVESKFMVNKMRETLNIKLSNTLDEYIRVYSQQPYDTTAVSIEDIKAVTTRLIAVVDALQSEMGQNMVVTNLLDRIQELSPGHPATQYHADWKKQQKFMQFLESVLPTQEDSNDFSKYHMRLKNFKQIIADNIKLMGRKAEETIDQAIGEVIAQAMTTHKTESVNLALSSQRLYSKLKERLEDVYNMYDHFQVDINSQNGTELKEFLRKFKVNFNVSESQEDKLESYQMDIDFFKTKVSTIITDGHQEKWLKGFNAPKDDIKKAAKWYGFIADSYTKLIDYDSQNAFTRNQINLTNWASFKQFRKELGTNKALDSYLESRLTLSKKEQTDLNNLIGGVQPLVTHTCQSSKLIIKGNLIKMSSVISTFIPKCTSFAELYIFATQTVFVDESLIVPMKNVYIVAPKWEVKGAKLINLRGSDANSAGQTKAGNPGQPGGNFIGIGDTFVNENELTIDVSGGNGGNGKDGANGRNGKDGETPKLPDQTKWHDSSSRDYCDSRIIADMINGFSRVAFNVFEMYGKSGEPGTSGGDGGKPGDGAKHGYVYVNSPQIKTRALIGINGKEGTGGKGGTGGENGKTRVIRCIVQTNLFQFMFRYEQVKFESKGRAENGKNGRTGAAGNRIDAAQRRSFESLSTVAGKYKEYVQQKDLRFVDSLEFINRHGSAGRKRRSIPVSQATPIGSNTNWKPQHLAIPHHTESYGDKSLNPEFSLTPFMILADIVIRKVMKIEPKNVETQVNPNWEDLIVQAEVLNIVGKCEQKWDALNQIKPEKKAFDPLCLQRELIRRVGQLADKSQVQKVEQEILEILFA